MPHNNPAILPKIGSVIKLATSWCTHASQLLTRAERAQQRRLQSIIHHPNDKQFFIELLDQSFRPQTDISQIQVVQDIYRRYGYPQFFTTLDRLLLKTGLSLASRFPKKVNQLIQTYIQRQSRHIMIPTSHLNGYLSSQHKKGYKSNINIVGDIVLSTNDAQQFFNHYIDTIRHPKVHYLSVKISSLCHTLYPLGHEIAKTHLIKQLTTIYSEALAHNVMVTLDMENHHTIALTHQVFKETLATPTLSHVRAGIVLQAYLPESITHYHDLLSWSKERVAKGGLPIHIRIVKGANLQMETIESSHHGWTLPTYTTKQDVDANFKAILSEALTQDHCRYCTIGIGSHNLFDVAWAYELARIRRVQPNITFEMLEGLSNHMGRYFRQQDMAVLHYTPTVEPKQFISAISYLMRRLDEHTGQGHFLRHAIGLTPNTPQWQDLQNKFEQSCHWESLSQEAKRQQNRNTPPQNPHFNALSDFQNEPNTNWYLPHHQEWAHQIKDVYCRNVEPEMELWTPEQVTQAIELAQQETIHWQDLTTDQRHDYLRKTAEKLREKRAHFIGLMASITHKPFVEADTEVSEAIDFLEFYPLAYKYWSQQLNLLLTPIGIGLVISPWNFPLAIPCGGIVASLMSGNVTLLKPAPEAMSIALALASCFWDAGIPKTALQVITCQEDDSLTTLTNSQAIDFMIFTGSTNTAKTLIKSRPEVPIYAETGGKNATIITQHADYDQAISNLLQSAFGYSGQKCSATSLLILEDAVYNDDTFKRKLKDAINSIHYGIIWQLHNRMGPLISPLNKHQKQAISQLDTNESWLIPPKVNGNLLSPCVKWGVQAGSFMHQTELFAPILSVMKADSLSHAIELVNDTGYGLTSGLESLSKDEHTYWQAHINAGNLYINRPTTGAIVNRHPFGGYGHSAFGNGYKAGGLNYLLPFFRIQQLNDPHPLNDILTTFTHYYADHFQKDQVLSPHVIGERNTLRYRPKGTVLICIEHSTSIHDAIIAIFSAFITQNKVAIHIQHRRKDPILSLLNQHQIKYTLIDDMDWILHSTHYDLIRWVSNKPPSRLIQFQLSQAYKQLSTFPVIAHPHIEMSRYLNEQCISQTTHRYGMAIEPE